MLRVKYIFMVNYPMEMDNEWHQRGQFEVRKAKDQLKRILLVYVYEYSRM